MSETTRYQRHEGIMTRLADAQGVDLDLAILRGDLSPEDYTNAVLACTGCSAPDACERHLAENGTGIPSFCRNADTMARLARDIAD